MMSTLAPPAPAAARRTNAAPTLASPCWATLLMRLDASNLRFLASERRNEALQHAVQATRIQIALNEARDDLERYPADSAPWLAARQLVAVAQARHERALRALDSCLDGRSTAIVPAPDWESERPLECAILRDGAAAALVAAIRAASDDMFGRGSGGRAECLLWDAVARAHAGVEPICAALLPYLDLPPELVRRLRALSARSNGWAHVPPDGKDFAFVDLGTWKRLYAGFVERLAMPRGRRPFDAVACGGAGSGANAQGSAP
jgi:hypothetical protein